MGWDKGQLAIEGYRGKTSFHFLLLPLYIVYSVLGLQIVLGRNSFPITSTILWAVTGGKQYKAKPIPVKLMWCVLLRFLYSGCSGLLSEQGVSTKTERA